MDIDPRSVAVSPADRLINRYMPNATAEEREAAQYSLQHLARILMRIEDRLAKEWWDTTGKALHEPSQAESSNIATVIDEPG